MGRVVHHTKFPFNDLRYSSARPHVPTKAVRFRTVGEQVGQQRALRDSELGWPARTGTCI